MAPSRARLFSLELMIIHGAMSVSVASFGVLVVLRDADLIDERHLPLLELILAPILEAQFLPALRHCEPHLEEHDPTAHE